MIGRVDLGVGVEAHAILTRPCGRGKKSRRAVEGVAVVRIVDAHVDGRFDVFRCVVLRGSYAAGREVEIKRCDLYASSEPAELAEFQERVNFYWRAA